MPHLRRLAAILAALTLTFALAACGDDEDSGSAASTTGTNATESFPVTVEHKFGSTTIESEPKRVVALGYTDQDPVLALGVVPVGVGDFLGGYKWRERPWAQEALKGQEPKVVGGQQINFEAVAAQRPDVIFAINAGLKEADYERLSRIAPTIGQDGKYVDFGMPWEEQQQLVGKALGRTEQADQVIAETKAKFEEVRKAHPEFEGKTAILAYGGPDGYGAYTTQDTRSRFLADLGFKTAKEVDELAGESFFAEFSQEQFRLIDQDLVLMYGEPGPIEKNPVVMRLDAIKQDRVVYLPYTSQFAGALGFSSALSLQYLLDTAPEQIAAAVDGDPATKVEPTT